MELFNRNIFIADDQEVALYADNRDEVVSIKEFFFFEKHRGMSQVESTAIAIGWEFPALPCDNIFSGEFSCYT